MLGHTCLLTPPAAGEVALVPARSPMRSVGVGRYKTHPAPPQIAFAPYEKFGEDTPEVKYLAKIMKDSEMLGYTVATVEGFYKLTPTSPSSCKVTMVVQGKLGGSIPQIAMDATVKKSLAVLIGIQSVFERAARKVDADIRAAFPPPPPSSSSPSSRSSS